MHRPLGDTAADVIAASSKEVPVASRTIVSFGGALVIVAAAACSSLPPSVRGIQQPGAGTVVAQLRVSPELTQGMPAGSASYVGASVDGSLIGFLTADGYIKWYRTR
jgi:hypothetical protein